MNNSNTNPSILFKIFVTIISVHWVLTWYSPAQNERVPSKTFRTAAYRNVVQHITTCSLTTSARTRISTFVPDTSSVPWTVSTQDTFRSTPSIGVSLVLWQTCAYTITTLRVGTTRRWITWVNSWWQSCRQKYYDFQFYVNTKNIM
jgi:hypothetical protein